MPLLETRALRKTYGSGDLCVEALRGIDLKVEQGEFLAIMGPSGSGKSTLLHLLGGVDRPTSGQVLLEGGDLTALSDDASHDPPPPADRLHLSIVQPAAHAQRRGKCLAAAGTGGNPDAGGPGACGSRSGYGRHVAPPHAPAEQALRRRTTARGDRPGPGHRAGACCLADEPTGNLDTSNGRQVTSLLRRLVTERRQTIVMVTHDPNVAAHADRLVCLRDGLIESDNEQTPLMQARRATRPLQRGEVLTSGPSPQERRET